MIRGLEEIEIERVQMKVGDPGMEFELKVPELIGLMNRFTQPEQAALKLNKTPLGNWMDGW